MFKEQQEFLCETRTRNQLSYKQLNLPVHIPNVWWSMRANKFTYLLFVGLRIDEDIAITISMCRASWTKSERDKDRIDSNVMLHRYF